MNRAMTSTINNGAVRFIKEGFDATYPFALGASGFAGLSGGVMAYKAFISQPAPPEVKPTQHVSGSAGYSETFDNQAEGAAMMLAGIFLGVVAVSAFTGSLARVRRIWAKNDGPATQEN